MARARREVPCFEQKLYKNQTKSAALEAQVKDLDFSFAFVPH